MGRGVMGAGAGLVGVITESTCSDGCWYAREEVCRCSCGGSNHGCLRGEGGEQPIRTAKIDGVVCELRAVGYRLDKDAQAINEAAGITYRFAHTARQHWGYQNRAFMRPATEGQVRRWPELSGYVGNLREVWREAHPGEIWARWPGLPYLLWVRKS